MILVKIPLEERTCVEKIRVGFRTHLLVVILYERWTPNNWICTTLGSLLCVAVRL